MQIIQASDAKVGDELFATRKAALQKLNADTVFHALLCDQYPINQQPPNPVSVTLAMDSQGLVTGSAQYAFEGCTMKLASKMVDTPLGPQIAVQYSGGDISPSAWNDASTFVNLVQHEAWLLSPVKT